MWALVLWCVLGRAVAQLYVVPDPDIHAFHPRGLHVSIPDEEGIEIFAVHMNVNKPIHNVDPGDISIDVKNPKNGRWVYENYNVRLKVGDVLNYWLYVQKDGLGYQKLDQTYTITEKVDPESANPNPQFTQPPPTLPPRPVPPPEPKCEFTESTINGLPACKAEIMFHETFEELNKAKWQHVIQFAGEPDYQFVLFEEQTRNAFVKNGMLNIKPMLMSDIYGNGFISSKELSLLKCTSSSNLDCQRTGSYWNILPPIISAKLRTKNSFTFRYGVVEIKAKLPLGDWIVPEIRLEPKDNSYGNKYYSSGLIHIAMSRGNRNLTNQGIEIGNNVLEAGCKYGLSERYKNDKHLSTKSVPWSKDFQVFKLIWTPEEITFTVNGETIGSVTPPPGGFGSLPEFSSAKNNPWLPSSKMAPFDKEFFLTIGLGVGGHEDFPDNCKSGSYRKPWKNREPKAMYNFWKEKNNWFPTWSDDSSLKIDYVKVSAL